MNGNYCSKLLNEWYEIAYPIITHPEFQRRKTYKHHGEISVYDHVIRVSIYSYILAKKRGLDYKSALIAGLLHDFYETPWMEIKKREPLFKKHGFTHARNALNNARKYFPEYMNPIVENAILRHMFPLNITPPKYREAWLVSIADKRVSGECFHEPQFFTKTFLSTGGNRIWYTCAKYLFVLSFLHF